MTIREFEKFVQERTPEACEYFIDKTFRAYSAEDGRLIAEYKPRTGKLYVYDI